MIKINKLRYGNEGSEIRRDKRLRIWKGRR